MKKLVALVALALVVGLAGSVSAATAYPGEYLIISTNTAGGGGVYSVNEADGALTFVENLPNPGSSAKIGYYHAADDTLYFTQDDVQQEWSVVLEDVLNPGIVASSTNIWDAGGEADNPARMVLGPDGLIYTHSRYGPLYTYTPAGDVETNVGAHTDYHLHHHEMAAYGDGIYVSNATVTNGGATKWTHLGGGTWSAPADAGVTGLADCRGNFSIRQSDGMLFAGNGTTVQYVDLDVGGAAAAMPAVGSGGMGWGGMTLNPDGTKLWISGNNGGQFLGYFDITGDLSTATWHEIVAPGAGLTGLSGTSDWGLTAVDTGAGEAPIPEPAGLGLVGLALLAVRKRRS